MVQSKLPTPPRQIGVTKLPNPISEQQQYDIALVFASQLEDISITQALYILQDLTPRILTNSHTVNKETVNAAKERLFSGGSV